MANEQSHKPIKIDTAIEEKLSLVVKGWKAMQDVVGENGTLRPVTRVEVTFDHDQITEASQIHPVAETLQKFLTSKGLDVRSGASGFLSDMTNPNDRTLEPRVLFTINSPQPEQLQEALKSIETPKGISGGQEISRTNLGTGTSPSHGGRQSPSDGGLKRQ